MLAIARSWGDNERRQAEREINRNSYMGIRMIKTIIHLQMWAFFCFGALAGHGIRDLYEGKIKEARMQAVSEVLIKMSPQQLTEVDI